VEDEIASAMDDPDGLVNHQRRLAFMISLGVSELVEIYFHKLGIIKEGSRIKHEWFKKNSIAEILSNQIVKPIEDVRRMGEILSISKDIESARNDLAYSSPIEEEGMLRDEISMYFKVKEIIEEETGEIHE
jgi:hypothetical protein